MTELRDVDGIQLNQDLPFLRREWRVQRIGWLGMGVVVLLALVGVFGHGKLSRVEQGDRASLAIQYQRVIRHAASTQIQLVAAPGLPADSTLRIYFSQDYLSRFRVEHIVPPPTGGGAAGTLVFYEFARPNPEQPARIVFELMPIRYWRMRATAAVAGATPLRFSQFVLP